MQKAIKILKKENVKIQRPNDYFAQMIKSDKQIMKIESRLKEEKEKLVLSEKKREQKIQKKNQKKWKHQKNI